jgi:hypothetical protein
MQHNSDDLLLETGQGQDTFLRTLLGEYVSARLLSVRSQEAQMQDLLNQDYACLLSRKNASSLVFCVCDGVGSSYRGDFAAHYLAGQLLNWLQEMPEIPLKMSLFSDTLHTLLDVWAHDAQMKLRQMPIPPETPGLVCEVLEELRDTYGSETVFFCGRVDAGDWPLQSNTLYPIRIVFCWMGNVTMHLSISADRCIVLGDDADDTNRWSTLQSRRGEMTIWSDTLSTIEHLIIHTDGLDSVGARLASFTNAEWQTQTQQLLQLPKNDDMTALELRWMHKKKDLTS